MNPRQRRGMLLIGVSVIGAVAVFVMVANYVTEVQARVGPVTSAVALAEPTAANVPITADMLSTVEMPERWLPAGAIRDAQAVIGLVSASALPAGTVLQDGMVVDAPGIDVGDRELAILVDAETGVAGKIAPGNVVDVIATFPGEHEGEPARALFVLQRVTIIDVGAPATAADETAGGFAAGQVVPVTFKLTTAEALRLAYVETFASTVRLTLRSPLDDSRLRSPDVQYAPRSPEEFPGDDAATEAADEDPDADEPDPGTEDTDDTEEPG